MISEAFKIALAEYGQTIQEQGWRAGEPLIEKYSEQFADFRRWAYAVGIALRAQELLEEPMTQEHRYFYVLVRTDLTPAQQMCQAVHAAHEAGIHFGDKSSISSVVICSIPDEQALRQAIDWLKSHEIIYSIFSEPDLDNQITAVATEPLVKPARKFMSKFPLWRAEYVAR